MENQEQLLKRFKDILEIINLDDVNVWQRLGQIEAVCEIALGIPYVSRYPATHQPHNQLTESII